ncbi:hypothetical protein RJ641_012363 [Dillenia turbinata]|uniref:Uncharacterized protein n=1 Tax=Dillenia turbinata TaxID=194707 RepID=A0AAN8Z263_9MAGN
MKATIPAGDELTAKVVLASISKQGLQGFQTELPLLKNLSSVEYPKPSGVLNVPANRIEWCYILYVLKKLSWSAKQVRSSNNFELGTKASASRGAVDEIPDHQLVGECNMEEVKDLAKIGLWCLDKSLGNRPSIEEVSQAIANTR